MSERRRFIFIGSVALVMMMSACWQQAEEKAIVTLEVRQTAMLPNITIMSTPTPVAPTPAAAPTTSPPTTPTTAPTATWFPPPTPTLFPPSTPVYGPDNYRLRPWSEQSALALLEDLDVYAQSVLESGLNYRVMRGNYSEANLLLELILLETLLRFPDSAQESDMWWRLAHASSHIYEFYRKTSPDEVLQDQIITSLNSGQIAPDMLDQFLNSHGFAVWKTDARNREVNIGPVINLFGDEQVADIFLIVKTNGREQGTLIALRQHETGSYSLEVIDSLWSPYTTGYLGISHGDLTGDGIPEIVTHQYSHSGTLHSERLQIWQWQDGSFWKLPSDIRTETYVDWTITRDEENDRNILQTVAYPFVFSYTIVTSTYAWNGQTINLIDHYSDISENPEPYAIEAIDYLFEQPERQIMAFEEFLQDPKEREGSLTPDGFPDVVRFRLAMLYLAQDQNDDGINALRSITHNPTNPITPTISLAAQAFLDVYEDKRDLYHARHVALEVMTPTPDGQTNQNPGPKTWGYVTGFFGTLEICDLNFAFNELVRTWNRQSDSTSVLEYLESANVPIEGATSIDLDGDGNDDWLVTVPQLHQDGKTLSNSFVLISEGNTYEHERLGLREVQNVHKTDSFWPLGMPAPIHLMLFDSYLAVFTIDRVEERHVLRQWWSNGGVNFSYISDFEMVQEDGEFWLTISYDLPHEPESYDEAVYRWDTAAQEFVLVERHAPNSLGIPLEDAAVQAESLLLDDGNALEAIPLLSAILGEAELQYEPFSRPRLQYLLGLAYELSGEKAAAVNAYWTLWQTYPESPYVLLAQAKLEHH